MIFAVTKPARKHCFLCIVFFLCCFVSRVNAVNHDALTLNGLSSFVELSSETYLAALYLESLNNTEAAVKSAKGNKRMEIRVFTPVWRERSFLQTWNRAILINNSEADRKTFAKEINAFTHLLQSPLELGDHITIDMTPRTSTTVSINGFQVMNVASDAFFNVLLNCWIGSKPPSSEFKKNILSYNAKDAAMANLFRRFDKLVAQNPVERDNIIGKWKGVQAKAVSVTTKSAAELSKDDPKSPYRKYLLTLNKESQRRSFYPDETLVQENSGEVVVSVTLNNKGALLNAEIEKEDPFKPFNTAAMDAVKKSRFMPFPAELKETEHSFSLIIKFAPPNPTESRIGG